MPQILTTNAVILCPHGGRGTSVPTDPKWAINGGIVLLDGDAGTLTCPFIPPCAGYQLRSMELNATRIGSRKVMLTTDFTPSFTGFPLTLTEIHQVIDQSTPTAIPAGSPPPPVPLELQENDQPVVTAAPGALAFSLSGFGSTGFPMALPLAFTLQSQFPRQWLLSFLTSPAGHRDITNGEPPNIVVLPAGGAWATPGLSITVTLTGAFMSTLPVGAHYLVLAAVNHRGLSAFAQAILTVSA